MWFKLRLLSLILLPFLFGFYWGQAKAYEERPVLEEETFEAGYREGWRDGARHVGKQVLASR